MDFGGFSHLADFLGISETLRRGTQKEPPKGAQVVGSRKLPTAQKGATEKARVSIENKAVTPFVIGFTVEEAEIKAKDLERLRTDFDLTQEEIAKLLGVSLSTIQKIKQGCGHENRRDFKLRFLELVSIYKFLKKRISSKAAMRLVFKAKNPHLSGKTILEGIESFPEDDRIYEISGLLRRQFG